MLQLLDAISIMKKELVLVTVFPGDVYKLIRLNQPHQQKLRNSNRLQHGGRDEAGWIEAAILKKFYAMNESLQSLWNTCNASIHILTGLKDVGGPSCKMYDEFIDVLRYACEIDGRRGITDVKERVTAFHDLLSEDEQIIRFVSNPYLRKTYDTLISNVFKCTYRLLGSPTEGYVARVFGQQHDSEGRSFWEEKFNNNFMVRFDGFFKVWEACWARTFDNDTIRQLRYLLDYNQTGYVSVHRFVPMISTFGPFSQCLHNVNDLFSKHWFYGYMTQREAEELLSDEPSSFLVRFDLSRSDCVVISSNVTGSVKHYAVSFVSSQRRVAVWSEEEGRVVERESIGQFVTESNLGRPYISDIPRMKGFCGDVQTADAGFVLAGKCDGTYLLRLSSKPGFYAVSYVINNGEKNTEPHRIEEEIKKNAELAQIPIGNLSFRSPTPKSSLSNSGDFPSVYVNHAAPRKISSAENVSNSPITSVYATFQPKAQSTIFAPPPKSPPTEHQNGSLYVTAAALQKQQASPSPPRMEAVASRRSTDAEEAVGSFHGRAPASTDHLRQRLTQMQQSGGSFVRAQPQGLMAMTRRPSNASPNVRVEEAQTTIFPTSSTTIVQKGDGEEETSFRIQQLEQKSNKVKEMNESLSTTVQRDLSAALQQSLWVQYTTDRGADENQRDEPSSVEKIRTSRTTDEPDKFVPQFCALKPINCNHMERAMKKVGCV
ncbi:hypothetical protein PROFUN_08611 [Planoprotostelium fungivorum]|uniref:SH2 domain-containing protein n=1 Tax=Planoprotostelium fungivorum TaxID=1890364 RepID=A0A2P6NJ95_9EUKA|nr:hypothetical protein PROFUN_08611 [Planoprotostelium fungivorum]